MKNQTIKTTTFFSLFTFTALVLFTSCIEKIKPQGNYEKKLIVISNLSNKPENLLVNITKTLPLGDKGSDPVVKNAKISLHTSNTIKGTPTLITDDFLFDNNENVYKSRNIIATNIGSYYWIEIVVDGKKYRSDREQLLSPIKGKYEQNNAKAKVTFEDDPKKKNFYVFSAILFDKDGRMMTKHPTNAPIMEVVASNDILFDGKKNASLEIELFVAHGDTRRLNFQHVNYSTYKYMLDKQFQRDNAQGDDAANMLFLPPPSDVYSNITDLSTNKKILGIFNVVSNSY